VEAARGKGNEEVICQSITPPCQLKAQNEKLNKECRFGKLLAYIVCEDRCYPVPGLSVNYVRR
jgi:hypothetical protein